MKLVLISDSHNQDLSKLTFPEGELLIHAGDLTMGGTLIEVNKALLELDKIAEKYKYGCVFIAGNHDGLFEEQPVLAESLVKEYKNLVYLNDSGTIINGLKIWGSPVQPFFCNWWFNRQRGEDIKRHWDLIPNDTNLLMVHGPVQGIHDFIPWDNEHVGCKDLADKVFTIKPKLFVCGHLHLHGGSIKEFNGTTFVNASLCNEQYQAVNNPIVIEI